VADGVAGCVLSPISAGRWEMLLSLRYERGGTEWRTNVKLCGKPHGCGVGGCWGRAKP
jgi:hypothetical protein